MDDFERVPAIIAEGQLRGYRTITNKKFQYFQNLQMVIIKQHKAIVIKIQQPQSNSF
jgi:hypothetical protein